MRYGSGSNTNKRTVKIKGSVRFTLPTVKLKNGTVTVAIAVKNGMVKKSKKRYGHGSGDKFGLTIVMYLNSLISPGENGLDIEFLPLPKPVTNSPLTNKYFGTNPFVLERGDCFFTKK